MKFTVLKKSPRRNTELFSLLNISPYNDEDKKRLNGAAIIKEVRRAPKSAQFKYQFQKIGLYYPLQMAVRLGAAPDVLEALYRAYPPALHAENLYGDTVLHLALRYRADADVVLFLLDKWPGSTRKRDRSDCTPLHVACCFNAPWKVASHLVDTWPGALREKTSTGFTPLAHACMYRAPLDVVSLLLDRYPDSVRELTSTGCTPLHLACNRREAPLEIILKLLEKWPEATRVRNDHWKTPLDNIQDTEAQTEDVRTVLSYASSLLNNNNNDCADQIKSHDTTSVTPETALSFFTTINWQKEGKRGKIIEYKTEIEGGGVRTICTNKNKKMGWQKGVVLVLDQKPSLIQDLGVELHELPDFLCVVGRQCHIYTMFDILRNKQDVLAGT
uniref:Uncharacterized protein n=2 Tax=Helicotheca tamesis TaxID=374047 RepID=A0A7S2H608_9STRA